MDSIEFDNTEFWQNQGKKHTRKLDIEALKGELREMEVQIKQGKILGVDMKDLEIVYDEMIKELKLRIDNA